MAELTDIRDPVRHQHAEPATAAARDSSQEARARKAEAERCGHGAVSCSPADHTGVFGGDLYDQASRARAPSAAVNVSLG